MFGFLLRFLLSSFFLSSDSKMPALAAWRPARGTGSIRTCRLHRRRWAVNDERWAMSDERDLNQKASATECYKWRWIPSIVWTPTHRQFFFSPIRGRVDIAPLYTFKYTFKWRCKVTHTHTLGALMGEKKNWRCGGNGRSPNNGDFSLIFVRFPKRKNEFTLSLRNCLWSVI